VFKTFPSGGIHPPDLKLTGSSPVLILPLPENVTIPVSQHIGAPAVPLVGKGDFVKTGQLIAEGRGFVSSNIHSSVSGRVSKIDSIIDATGYRQSAIFIDVSGDEWTDSIDRSSVVDREIKLPSGEIINKCRESGIVGMGGAAFPSHVKLTIPEGKKCNLLIINGVECEPYLTSDHRLMVERAEEVLTGVTILMKALNVDKAMIGIEANKPDAIAGLSEASLTFKGISVHGLKVKYPQGAEKQLIKALTNREVPHGKLPLDLGIVVQNVATAFAVYEAVQKNKPLFERVVTITGKSLSHPGNYLVRIGTPISKLIDAAGGLPEDTGKVINGGPMMGKSLNNYLVPVVKGTSGIILIPEEDAIRAVIKPCIRCAKCSSACSFNQEPFLLAALAERGLWERAEREGITKCMECGSCSYVCPANRPILDYIRLGKSTVNSLKRERNAK
jgi:Na+-translocating ferredoxin:NAD+ oxidoreductase subunit C